jgi:hypothetical protein
MSKFKFDEVVNYNGFTWWYQGNTSGYDSNEHKTVGILCRESHLYAVVKEFDLLKENPR